MRDPMFDKLLSKEEDAYLSSRVRYVICYAAVLVVALIGYYIIGELNLEYSWY